MSGWLDGIERVDNDHNRGGSYLDSAPWRFCVHTVEGDPRTVSDCRLIAQAHASPPHLWFSPKLGWYGQTVPLDRSAFALAHPDGTPETNKAHVLQVEVFGFARESPGWPASTLDGIAYLLRRCITAGYPVDLTRVAATTGADGYGRNGKVRMSWVQWAVFGGVHGHANVPGNDHWDPGAANLSEIARRAGAPPPSEDDDMTPGQCRDATGRKWFFVVGDNREMFASVDGGDFFAIGGYWTSGLDAYLESDGVIVVAGRDRTGALSQTIIWTDGSPEPGRPPETHRIGGHIYPPA